MMWASKVSRSTMAAQRRGSVKVRVHSLKAALEAMAMEAWFRSSDPTAVVRDERPHPHRAEVHGRQF